MTDDIDHDGRLDIFLMAWEPTSESPLFRGAGAAGHWVELDVTMIRTNVPGARIQAHPSTTSRISHWVQTTTGYTAGSRQTVRFGLGDDVDMPMVALSIERIGGSSIIEYVDVDTNPSLGNC